MFKGLAMSLAVCGVTLLGSAAVADYLHYHRPWIIGLRVVSISILAAVAAFFLFRPLLKKIPDVLMARFIEERNPGMHDRLVSAVEFAEKPQTSDAPLIDKLIHDAAERSSSIDLNTVASQQRLWLYGGALLALLLIFGWLLRTTPDSLLAGLARLYAPWSQTASANPYAILVTPGDARLPKGADQPIMAHLQGFRAEQVDIYLKRPDQTTWVNQPMERQAEDGAYRFLLFNLQQNVSYYVEASNIRSSEFSIQVAELAWVDRLSLTYHFPAYTNMETKTVEDGGDIVALKGTTVNLLATLTRPAEGAKIVLEDGVTSQMEQVGPDQFAGQIVVNSKNTYRIDLTSEGETYTGSNVYQIVALEDEAPTVTIEKPGRDTKVTNIQEVLTQARAEDDNGVAELTLHVSVNGGAEQAIRLYRTSRKAPKQISGTHTFFLEEYKLLPGDFISYYATAKDGNTASGANEGASDIYFLEIRPFERSFRQAQQNGGGGGGSSALTKRQKEIIAATWRVIRQRATSGPEEFAENLNTITLMQERLKKDTIGLVSRIRSRFGSSLEEQKEFKQLAEYLEQAAKEMERALGELKAQKPKRALTPEQRALQQLMRADAIFRDLQVAFNTSGQGGGENADAEDLADLFELELDRMKNQYETLQRDRGQQQDKQLDETARKLRELARRQQQLAQQQMRRAQPGPRNQSGGSGWQQQQVMEQAQELARQLDRLSRQRQDRRLSEISRQLNQAAQQMQRAQQAGDSAESAARRLRAAEQLESAQRRLQSAQRARSQEAIERLQQQASEIARQQREIANEVDDLWQSARAGNRQSLQPKQRRIEQRKQMLADEVEGLQQEIESAARGVGQDRQSTAEQLRKSANVIRQNRLPDKIRRGNQLLQNQWYDQARQREQEIQQDLDQIVQNLQAAQGRQAGTANRETERLKQALNRARQLADDLESLQRRLEEQARDRGQASQNQQNQSGQSGQQQAESRGRQDQRGRPSGNQQDRNQQGQQGMQPGNRQNPNNTDRSTQFFSSRNEEFPTQGGRPRVGDRRQFQSELRQRQRDADALRQQLGSEFSGDMNELIRRLRQLDNQRLFNDPEEIARLKRGLIDPLRQLEHELMRRLQEALGQTGPLLADETSVPEGYRKLVDEYYKRLAKKK